MRPTPLTLPTLAPVAVLALLTAAALPAAADVGAGLADRWHGAWLITRTELYSDCDTHFTNNAVHGRVVSGKGAQRFAPGEVAKVEKLDLHKDRVDLLVTVVEPLRLSRQDGPFTLYDQAQCRVEVRIDLPRDLVKQGSLDALDRAMQPVLARFDSEPEARADAGWNRRRGEPIPRDYEQTLARYQVWKAAQVNVAVKGKMDQAVDEAAAVAARMRREPDYLAGFGDGVDKARDAYFGDCDWLLDSSEYAFTSTSNRGRDHDWSDGYLDGQRLVYWLELARRLRACLVPMPPPA
jgi:hypothetical protein